MQDFFVTIHQYMARRKALFITLFLLFLVLAGYLASGVRLEENLNAIIPEDQRISKISAAFDKSELADQIVFILSLKDTATRDPDLLIENAELLVNLLQKETSLINEINFKVGNDVMMEVYDFVLENLPLFLSDDDYRRIRGTLTEEGIGTTIQNDFKNIISPAGMATKKFILRDPLSLTPLALEKLNHFQLDDNFSLYNSAIFTNDRSCLLFFLDPSNPASNTQENLKLIRTIDQSIDSIRADHQDVRIEYYGGTAVAVANSVRVKKDIRLTVTIALVFFIIIFFVFFRKPGIIMLMFLPVIVGALISMAMLALLYGKVSAIALGIGVIFIGITVDYSLHLFTHLRTDGSMTETLRRISQPILMSSLTTASAFLCLTIVRSEAMNQIGVFAAFGVVATALTVLIVIPLILSGRRRAANVGPRPGRTGIVEKAVAYRFENNKVLVGIILVLTLLFAFTSQKIRFNGDISTLNYMTDRLSRAETRLKSISSMANSSVYLITQGKSIEEALHKLESNSELIGSCLEEGLATEISWVSELMPTEEVQIERIEKWNRFWAEADRDFVKDAIRRSGRTCHFKDNAFDPFFALLDREFKPVPISEFDLIRDLFLEKYISTEEGTCSVVSILKVDPVNKAALFKKVASSEDFIIFDNQYFINQFFDVLKEDFNRLVLISMGVVFLILLMFFGRIEIAMITFIPIMISWLWTLGLMGLFNLEINIFNIIISTFVFGLGIDYCIFVMNGIMAGYREGNHSLVPYKLSILLSALTTITGIGVLIFARHPALKSIAIVSIFGISTVVLISYTLLPLLFTFLTKSRGKKRLQPVTMFSFIASLITFVIFLGSAFIVSMLLPLFMILPLKRRVKKRMTSQMIYLFSNFIVGIGFFIKKKIIHRELLNFKEPAVLISNHQSQLDLVLLLKLHPKMIVLVNQWVWNNPFYGFIIRFADFYPVYKGLDHNLEQIQKKVKDGYSILAFPEASRSPDGEIKRFHQGAFGIADMLGLELQPLVIHGAYDCLPKTEHFIKPGAITLTCLPRMKVRPVTYEGVRTFREQAKEMTAFYRKTYAGLHEQLGTPAYHKKKIIGQFIYKGPVLEWYAKVKFRLEKNYSFFNELIPRDASVVDLGCGYGFLSMMLGTVSKQRTITGIDYDEKKIAAARNIVLDQDHVKFIHGDITTTDLPHGDIYLLIDVLHYLPEPLQLEILGRCMDLLPEDGMVIVRDADADLLRRTRYTKFTEIQSTRIFRFNKTRHKLTYLRGRTIEDFVKEKGFLVKRYDHSRLTSNIIYLISGKTASHEERGI
jgi:1-acyl-sn-glycerol-3-phosphate acyltransferase